MLLDMARGDVHGVMASRDSANAGDQTGWLQVTSWYEGSTKDLVGIPWVNDGEDDVRLQLILPDGD